MTRLNKNGMGQQVQSWIGSGQNQPINGNDVQRAVDPAKLRQIAQQQGMTTDEYSICGTCSRSDSFETVAW